MSTQYDADSQSRDDELHTYKKLDSNKNNFCPKFRPMVNYNFDINLLYFGPVLTIVLLLSAFDDLDL